MKKFIIIFLLLAAPVLGGDVMDAKDLYKFVSDGYKENELAFEHKYKGSLFIVSGIIVSICIISSIIAVAGDVYMWTDANGVKRLVIPRRQKMQRILEKKPTTSRRRQQTNRRELLIPTIRS